MSSSSRYLQQCSKTYYLVGNSNETKEKTILVRHTCERNVLRTQHHRAARCSERGNRQDSQCARARSGRRHRSQGQGFGSCTLLHAWYSHGVLIHRKWDAKSETGRCSVMRLSHDCCSTNYTFCGREQWTRRENLRRKNCTWLELSFLLPRKLF